MSGETFPGAAETMPIGGVDGPGRGRLHGPAVLVVVAAILGDALLAAVLVHTSGWVAACAVAPVPWLVLAVAGPVAARRLVAVTVSGNSMLPAYRDGDRVIARRRVSVRVGQVVVVERPADTGGWLDPALPRTAGARAVVTRRWMIKRVVAMPGDRTPPVPGLPGGVVPAGALVLLGDNRRSSYDSRQIGYFPLARVLGTVVHAPAPPAGVTVPRRRPRSSSRRWSAGSR
jgi:signal peptidase I